MSIVDKQDFVKIMQISSHSGTIISVNTSSEKGMCKQPVDRILVEESGIRGDAHSGAWNRQISLLSNESIHRFQQTHPEQITAGSFGENITTSGLPVQNAAVMDRFLINEVILEITQIGKKCHSGECSIFNQVGECIMPKEGIFCRVLHGGTIYPNDEIIWQPRALKILVITLSDRAFRGEYADECSPKIENLIETNLASKYWNYECKSVILPDDAETLRAQIKWAEEQGTDIIFTTGGTGIGPRDITPDIVLSLADKTIPGIMEFIRCKHGEEIPHALLSRSVAVVIKKILVFTLPGSPRAVEQYMIEILKILEHSIYMIHGIDVH